MSNSWSLYIIILTIASIAACIWLLYWTTNHKDGDSGTTGHVWDDDLQELNNPLPRWWLYLFYITIIFGLIYLLLYPGLGNFNGLLYWNQNQQYQQEVAQADAQYGDIYARFAGRGLEELRHDSTALHYGQRLFSDNCSICHGSDARGAPGFPNLRDNDWLYGGEPDTILHSILHGRGGMMPAFNGILDDDSIDQITAYILSLHGEHLRQERIHAGQQKFAQYCAACHGLDAKGNPVLGAPNLSDNIWLYSGRAENINKAIHNGLNGKMPAHKDILSPDKPRLIAAYILSLSDDKAP